MSEHTPEPLIYAAWVRALKRRLTVDELGALTGLLPGSEPVFLERVFRDVDGAGAWCDVKQTTAVETCAEMARRALDDALIELETAYGPRLESWRWGDAHQALHRHQTLGAVPVLRHLVNIRQSTAGRRPHAAARADAGQRAGALPQRARGRASAPSTTSPTPTRASSSSPPARAATRCRATTTTSPRCGGAPNTSRCRSTSTWPAPAPSAAPDCCRRPEPGRLRVAERWAARR